MRVDLSKIKKKVGKVEITTGAVLASDGSTEKNKTGGWRAMRPVTDHAKCTGCGICWVYRPDASRFKDKDGKYDVVLDYCKGCGICADVCPVKCITMVAEEK
ncbi:MAG: 4Fe-4S binding protein [Candidatus Altiarchaeota archaeon]|nr:4Fe-4S binding protein [Candidatus Altiarchaeota archaeon]